MLAICCQQVAFGTVPAARTDCEWMIATARMLLVLDNSPVNTTLRVPRMSSPSRPRICPGPFGCLSLKVLAITSRGLALDD
jgi:hypothetical protein